MGSWNYRVIEFVTPDIDGSEQSWRAIHEVHYDDNGNPVAYSENPAIVGWNTDEGLSTAFVILGRMQEALSKPLCPSMISMSEFRLNLC